jgi:hypothetical protein
MEPNMTMKCTTCVGAAIMFESKRALGEDVEIPEVNEAITMAPAWQQQRVGPNLIMACVTLPVCKMHMEVSELSPAEQAIRNGTLLEGAMTPNG